MIIIHIYDKKFFFDVILKGNPTSILTDEFIEQSYYNIKIKKKDGYRMLNCIENTSNLYKLQKNLFHNFLKNIPMPNYVCGFYPKSSYLEYLELHIRENYKDDLFYLRLDICNFFSNIDSNLINTSINKYIKINCIEDKEEIINTINKITMKNNVLPQGAITSPSLSNIVFRPLDIRIYKYCRKYKVKYSRYADDLLFSCENDTIHKDYFIKMIANIIKSYNLKINTKKVMKCKSRISLNGIVLSNNISLSRKKIKDISSILWCLEHNLDKNNLDKIQLLKCIELINNLKLTYRKSIKKNGENIYFFSRIDLENYLCGYRSFLISILKYNSNYKLNNYVKRIEFILDRIYEIDY